MNDISIEAEGASAVAPGRVPTGDAGATPEPHGVAMAALGAADYCHLAEECFFLAAVTKDPDAAADLLKAGDDYLRCAASWVADQLRT
jgi:hypothetical protein